MTKLASDIRHEVALESDLTGKGIRPAPYPINENHEQYFGDSAPSSPLNYNPTLQEITHIAREIYQQSQASGLELDGSRLYDIGAGTDARGYLFALLAGCSAYVAIEPFYADLLKTRMPADPEALAKYIPNGSTRLPSYAVIPDHALAVLRAIPADNSERRTFLVMCSGYARGFYSEALADEILRVGGDHGLVITWAAADIGERLILGGYAELPASGGFRVYKK